MNTLAGDGLFGDRSRKAREGYREGLSYRNMVACEGLFGNGTGRLEEGCRDGLSYNGFPPARSSHQPDGVSGSWFLARARVRLLVAVSGLRFRQLVQR